VLAFDETSGDPVAGPDLSAVTTVIAQSANINTVATNIGSVNTVAGNTTNINTVAGISGNVTTVAGIQANVTTVAGISSDVTAVAGNATNINAVAANATNINAVNANETNINAVNANEANINTVAGISADVTTVASIAADIPAAAAIDATDLAAVAGIAPDVTTVAGIAANVTTVANNDANITAVAGDATNIGIVASDIANVNAVGSNIAAVIAVDANETNINAVAANASNINQVASDTVAINAASANAASAAASATAASGSATDAANSAALANAVSLANEPVRHSVRPSLLLDFANTKALDPRITFARASTARFYDGKTVAKAEENLVPRSEEFNAWTNNNVTFTSGVTAPDGTSTAQTVSGDGTANFHEVSILVAAPLASEGYFSVFAKANGVNFIQLTTGAAPDGRANFDVSTGAIGTVDGSFSDAAITAVGGGWFRCSAKVAATNTQRRGVGLVSSGTAARRESWTTSGGVDLWGAQYEERASLTAYTPTTTQPITNYVPVLQSAANNVARFDHNPVTGESLGLLIEEQRSNLILQSEDLDTTWSETRSSLALNNRVSPNGTLTADSLIASVDNDTHFTSQTFTGTAANHTFSVYAKASGLNHVALRLFNGTSEVGLAYYNLSTGTTGTVTAGTASIQSVGNGWYRCVLTATLAASASCAAEVYLASADNTNSFAGNAFDGVTLWGMQVELGAFPTSYIPTVASQVTRSADAASMTGANFSSWYRADEGTMYAEANKLFAASGFVYDISDGTLANEIRQTWGATNIRFCEITTNGASQSSLSFSSAYVNGEFVKAAHSYKFNDVAASVNAATVATDTSATIPVVNQIQIGARVGNSPSINSYIKKLAFYPKRLADAELVALTQV
jgi:hypothetical protein